LWGNSWLTVMEYLCHKWPRIYSTYRKHLLVLSSFITRFVTRLTRRVPLVEQELFTLPEHLSSSPMFSGVRVTRSLVLCVCFVDRCLSFFLWPLCCLFFFGLRILHLFLRIWIAWHDSFFFLFIRNICLRNFQVTHFDM